MCHERAILCGDAGASDLPFAADKPLRLRMWGPQANVRLEIDDLHRAAGGEIPAALLDLIDIAVYVYCADQAVTRGGSGVDAFGDDWRRRLFFRIPVRDPDLWNDDAVRQALISALSFVSEDEYDFQFQKAKDEAPHQGYLTLGPGGTSDPIAEVVMFSGGLDSLGGAIQEAVLDNRRIALVHHRSTSKTSSRHKRLTKLLQQRSAQAPPVHATVRIHKKKSLSRESTQRSRSFLYATLGATIATRLGLDRLRFYENGVVSLNLPPCAQVVGARATRTTHPRFVRQLSELLSRVLRTRFTVENPFIWKTKTEVVRLIADAGCGELISHATSCVDTRGATRQHPHCGLCSQCIDRRFAILASEQQDNDPEKTYRVDLLTGERPAGNPRTMLAAYVETVSQITKMDAARFFSIYGEASRVLRHLDDNPEAAAIKVFELHRRHARDVVAVIDQAIAAHAADIRDRRLPRSCLIRLVCDASGNREPASPRRQATDCDYSFLKDGPVWRVRFAGGEEFTLLPSKGAAYLHILLSQPNIPVSAIDLACRVAKNPERYALEMALETSDRQALAAYRAKIVELRQDLATAKENNDSAAESRIEGEIAFLVEHLRQASGLRGQSRTTCNSNERVRKAVGAAIKRTIRVISADDQLLAEHLRSQLRCGNHPCYASAEGIHWETWRPLYGGAPPRKNPPLHEM